MFSRRSFATLATLSVAVGASALAFNRFNAVDASSASAQIKLDASSVGQQLLRVQQQQVVFAEGQSQPAYKEREQTFLMIKPDGVQRGLVGDIIQRFEKRGYKLVAIKMVHPSKELLQEHYADLSGRSFFPGLVKYMGSGPVVAMVWEGKDVVKQARRMLGETNPLASPAGSIRGDYSIEVGRNIMHGSDSVESAKHEISLWFTKDEVHKYSLITEGWVYE